MCSRKRFLTFLVTFLLAVILTLIASGCDKAEEGKSVVSFVAEGTVIHTVETAGNEVIALPDAPSKNGFRFDGWFYDDGVWKKPFGADSLKDEKLESDLSVYAKYSQVTVESFALSFAGGDGGTGAAPASQTLPAGKSYVLPESTFSKEGYDFAGWSDGQNTYSAGASFVMPQSNAVLNALWQVRILSVAFDTDGGNSPPPKQVNYGQSLSFGELPKVTKSGMLFEGWYFDEEKKIPFTYTSFAFTNAQTTLYANFTAPAPIDVVVEEQEETVLSSQPHNVSFAVISENELNNSNIYQYVSVVGLKDSYALPNLTVSAVEGKEYLLTPDGSYSEGASYVITVKDPLRLSVTVLGETLKVKKVKFSIFAENVYETVLSNEIITVGTGDYYYYDANTLALKNEFALEKAVGTGSVLCVADTTGNLEYYKAV